jgi:hypothetical protein
MKTSAKGESLGGISGVPGYVVRPNRAVELVGFGEKVVFNQIRFTLASFIEPDVTVK